MKSTRFKLYSNGLFAGIIILVYIYPIAHMFIMSFKPPKELFSTFFVFEPTLVNYIELFRRLKMQLYFTNSIIVASVTAVLSLTAGSIAAYSFSRYVFPGRKFLLFLVLFSRMLPPIGAVVPLYLMIRSWGITGTRFCLVLLYTAFNTPFVIWMMRGFFINIPPELEESAIIDGCTRLGAFFRIIVPISAPGLSATAIFSFTLAWNEFLFALIFTVMDTKTVPVIVPELIGEMGILWGQICGVGALAILPIMIFAFLVQKNLVRGLTFGAVKG